MHSKVSKNIDLKIFTLTTFCKKRGKSEWHVACLTAVLVKMNRGMDIFRMSVDIHAKGCFIGTNEKHKRGLELCIWDSPRVDLTTLQYKTEEPIQYDCFVISRQNP